MKKENKKMAQERRAAERKKQAMMKKIKTIVPIVLIIAVVALGIGAIWSSSDDGTTASDATLTSDTASTEDSTSTTDTTASVMTEPVIELDEALTYYADIEIEGYGTIIVELDQSTAPVTVANFVNLAQEGFYDGLTFHRIIEGFMIQGGDPNGNGTGGSEQNIVGEFSSNGYENNISHTRGTISMARSSAYDSASSQFFIMHEDTTSLDGDYAAFGYVIEGMDIVDAICTDAEPTDSNGTISAEEQPVITSITIRTE